MIVLLEEVFVERNSLINSEMLLRRSVVLYNEKLGMLPFLLLSSSARQ